MKYTGYYIDYSFNYDNLKNKIIELLLDYLMIIIKGKY